MRQLFHLAAERWCNRVTKHGNKCRNCYASAVLNLMKFAHACACACMGVAKSRAKKWRQALVELGRKDKGDERSAHPRDTAGGGLLETEERATAGAVLSVSPTRRYTGHYTRILILSPPLSLSLALPLSLSLSSRPHVRTNVKLALPHSLHSTDGTSTAQQIQNPPRPHCKPIANYLSPQLSSLLSSLLFPLSSPPFSFLSCYTTYQL